MWNWITVPPRNEKCDVRTSRLGPRLWTLVVLKGMCRRQPLQENLLHNLTWAKDETLNRQVSSFFPLPFIGLSNLRQERSVEKVETLFQHNRSLSWDHFLSSLFKDLSSNDEHVIICWENEHNPLSPQPSGLLCGIVILLRSQCNIWKDTCFWIMTLWLVIFKKRNPQLFFFFYLFLSPWQNIGKWCQHCHGIFGFCVFMYTCMRFCFVCDSWRRLELVGKLPWLTLFHN